MLYLNYYEPMFLVDEKQQAFIDQLAYHEMLFNFLRHDFLKDMTMNTAVYDLAYYLYEDKPPILNDNTALIYLTRHYIVRTMMKHPTTQRVKRSVEGSQMKSIMAAALIVNIFCDFLREILALMDEESQLIWQKITELPVELFNARWQEVENYPKKYVMVQTAIIHAIRKKFEDNTRFVEEQLQEAVHFVSEYNYFERKLFEATMR